MDSTVLGSIIGGAALVLNGLIGNATRIYLHHRELRVHPKRNATDAPSPSSSRRRRWSPLDRILRSRWWDRASIVLAAGLFAWAVINVVRVKDVVRPAEALQLAVTSANLTLAISQFFWTGTYGTLSRGIDYLFDDVGSAIRVLEKVSDSITLVRDDADRRLRALEDRKEQDRGKADA